MMIPVRCFTCGGVVGGKYEAYKARTDTGEDAGKVMDDLDIPRYCCRRMLLTHVDVIEESSKFHV